jgi:hypothetical protein
MKYTARAQNLIVGLIFAVGLGSLAFLKAGAVTQDFDAFITGRGGGSQPLSAGTLCAIVQGGVTKQVSCGIFATLSDTQTLTNKTISGSSNTLTVLSGSQLSGSVPVANGGTNLSSGTSGGVLCATGSGTYAFSSALTASRPVIGGGAGACPTVGAVTGTGSNFITSTGSTPLGQGGSWDASGNWVANSNAVFANVATTFTARQTFNEALSNQNNIAVLPYTIQETDCGRPLYVTSSSGGSIVLPNSNLVPCTISVEQGGAGQITFTLGAGALGNGAGGPANAHGFTKTFGPSAIIGLAVDTNSGGASAHWVLTGDGST